MGMSTAHVNIEYNVQTDKYTFSGTANDVGRKIIIEEFLRSQIGAGVDMGESERRDVYHIQIEWDPDGDVFKTRFDTGNKGLRDGILMQALSILEKE